MDTTGTDRPRIVIVGAGISGWAVASMLEAVPADVMVLGQAMSPGRQSVFSGIVSAADLFALGLTNGSDRAWPIRHVTLLGPVGAIASSRGVLDDWFAIEHGHLLEDLASSTAVSRVTFIPDAPVTGFLWDQGVVSGVENSDTGVTYPANLIVLADESSPRLAEALGLRPDWSPPELMHIGKRRYGAKPDDVRDRFGNGGAAHDISTFELTASWGSTGWGLVIPCFDSITLIAAMSLEEAMVSTRHISEYLDEIERQPEVRPWLAGLSVDAYATEVVPVGGFDARNIFHTDGVVVCNDLVGVTHPLNRDGLSSNLTVCNAAAQTIARAVTNYDFRGLSLRQYSLSVERAVISPVNAARRTDKSLRARPPWMWAAKAALSPGTEGVTTGSTSATLLRKREPGILQRLRAFGRGPGARRHAPGEYDD